MMTLEGAREILSKQFRSQEFLVEQIDSFLSFDGLIPFEILVFPSFDRSSSIKVKDDHGDEVGEILFTKSQEKREIQSLPFEKFICFLHSNAADSIAENDFEFTSDYLLLKKNKLPDYLARFKSTSPIWGGYFHLDNITQYRYTKTNSIREINAIDNLNIDRDFYFETLATAFRETNPFTRFLKLYHMIELKFDIHTAEKIKDLLDIGNKEKEISRTLRDYSREDIERLKSLFSLKLDPNKIVPYLENVSNFKTKAESIFYEYGKDSNPIKEKKSFDKLLTIGFSEISLNQVLGNNRFKSVIPALAAYWIYRIRSSIAHNKLGEYLMTQSDEDIIVEFAEPLLREIITQCYKK
jgi:hypothetical protein